MKNINFRDSKVILSILALIAFVLKNYGLFEMIGLDEAGWNELVTLTLAVGITAGIFNNPTKDKNK